MLTRDLVRARVKGREVVPTFVDPTRRDLLEPAEALCEAVARVLDDGGTRGELAEALDAVVGVHRSAKVLRGLQKLLVDRCTFEVEAPRPPSELRDVVFRAAAAVGPLALEAGRLDRPTAASVLASVAETLDLTPLQLRRGLYADLQQEQVLTAARPLAPDALLHRYNVSLVQAILLRALRVEVVLASPTAPRTRQLLRWAKFHQLLFQAHREDDGLHLVLDGPSSLFRQSTRYGLQLALFFPAVLLQDGPWHLEAEVEWTKARHRKRLALSSADGLVGHLPDTGAWVSREQQQLVARWEALGDTGWSIRDDTAPIALGSRGVVMPDLTFEHADGRTAHLEIVGYWRRDALERRLEGLVRHGPGNLVLAVSRNLQGCREALADFPGWVVPFAKVVPPKAVLEAVESVGRVLP